MVLYIDVILIKYSKQIIRFKDVTNKKWLPVTNYTTKVKEKENRNKNGNHGPTIFEANGRQYIINSKYWNINDYYNDKKSKPVNYNYNYVKFIESAMINSGYDTVLNIDLTSDINVSKQVESLLKNK